MGTIQLQAKRHAAGFTLDVDLHLPAKGITVLFGPSGSGKTTCLRVLAGLEHGVQGRVQVGSNIWMDSTSGTWRPPHQRAVGYVFQEASLLPHLSVEKNLRFGFDRTPPDQRRLGWNDALDLLGIAHLLKRRPSQLSGGERQRVAIARALTTRPQMLLLDEPLAALDMARRREILPWLERMRDELHLPMLYVTHSADELARLADHLVILEAGQVKASGPVAHVMAATDPPVVVGEDVGALLGGVIVERDARWHLARVAFSGGSVWLRDDGLDLGRAVRLRILARDVSLTTQEASHTSIQNHLQGVIEAIVPDTHPSQALVRVRCGEAALLARVTSRALDALALTAGCQVWLQVKSAALVR